MIRMMLPAAVVSLSSVLLTIVAFRTKKRRNDSMTPHH
jgi:hypothetical protein